MSTYPGTDIQEHDLQTRREIVSQVTYMFNFTDNTKLFSFYYFHSIIFKEKLFKLESQYTKEHKQYKTDA